MRTTSALILLTLMMSIIAGQAMAADNPNLDVSLLSYTPVPAEPGSYVTIKIKAENTGSATATQAAVEFVDNYPFSVEAEKLKSIGSLAVGSYYFAEYRVRIDSAALDGTNYLKIRYTTNGQNWFEKELALTVNSVQETIGINDISLRPSVLSPGEQATVTFKIKNLGTSDLREVSLKLNLEGIVAGTTYIDLPFAPIGSSVEKRIAMLKSGQTTEFEFTLQAYPEAEAGIYKVPLTLSYTDTAGTTSTRTDLFGIPVNSGIDILAQIDSSTLYSDNGKGDVSVTVTNKGLSDIKFLTITLEDTPDYTIKSLSNEVYVGNVDSDDYETAEFTLKMDKQGLEQVVLPVKLTFKDALNRDYELEEELTLQLITTADAGHEKSKAGTVIIIVAALAVVGFFVLRAKKRKK